MTDSPPPGDGSPHDERDDVLAAQLAVPALDEVTRRRLVRGALDATEPAETPASDQGPGHGRARGRWWAAAAAAVVVAGLVTAVVLRGGGSDDRPTAARAPASTRSPSPTTGTDLQPGGATDRTVTPSTESLAPAAGAPAASPDDLGQLGEVADRETLRDRVDTARSAFSDTNQAFGSSLPEAAPKITPKAATSSTAIPCAAELTAARPGLGAVEAVGTATFHGKPATVVVAATRSGRTVAVVIVDAGCVVHSPVTLTG